MYIVLFLNEHSDRNRTQSESANQQLPWQPPNSWSEAVKLPDTQFLLALYARDITVIAEHNSTFLLCFMFSINVFKEREVYI